MASRKDRRARISVPRVAEAPPSPAVPGRLWLVLPALLTATLAAYYPVWFGGFIWDDSAHLTAPALRSAGGLWRIWFDLDARPQYYPVTHSAFWLMHRLWGEQAIGYHLVNIGLHATSAFLLMLLLRRLAVPGALLAAVIFALHPVHVESVAWISELKNTLSGVLYLLAALAYLAFDTTRRPRSYLSAFALFVLALLSKTVVATLPAALLVVVWWKRGRLGWADIKPLAPMFALGIAAGLGTAWVERTYIGAAGAEFDLSVVERCLIAGRGVWFYLGKLVWPSPLMFIYPRWELNAAALWQYLYPLSAIAVVWALWLLRHRSRAPLAAALLFGGTLVPALGFVDVYPFRFSFVADHFQYLASLAPLALASAILAPWTQRSGFTAAAPPLMILALGIPLGLMTWHQGRDYADAETLYRSTLWKNPACWMCHNNLAKIEQEKGRLPEALAHLDDSLRLHPSIPEAHDNRGVVLRMLGRRDEALVAHQEAVRLAPDFPKAHFHLAGAYEASGRLEEALTHYREALRLTPGDADAHHNAGAVLWRLGRLEEAVREMTQATQLNPDHVQAHDSLGTVLSSLGRLDEALERYDTALRLDPANASARNNRATALLGLGRLDEAIVEYRRALEADGNSARTHDNLGFALFSAGRPAEALVHTQEAIRLDPEYSAARVTLGVILLNTGRPAEAIPHFQTALERPAGIDVPQILCDLGVAFARTGRRDLAIGYFREALKLQPDHPEARLNLSRALGR
jgi:tetratricopeptide (TPR) repeat protein